MRVCASCGRQNPDDRDFCACGEYLRWEPTNFVPAVSAPASDPAVAEPATVEQADPNVTLAPDAAPAARAWGAPAGPDGIGGGVAPLPGTPGSGDAPPGAAALLLRLPDDDSASPGVVNVSVAPGEQTTILGLIRNQSQVVDNFDLWIRGLPEDWWTVAPATAYLVPYGAGGTYEQEIQIHLHPPRSPQAQAREWSFEVVAESRAYGGEVVSAPASVTVGPYYDVATELRPERASGRLKARYRLIVRNRANARTQVALSAEDTDGECQFRFAQPSVAIEPGNAIECPFTVFPPKQIWVGKRLERRFQVTAAPTEIDTPPPPRTAVFRQQSWLPRWLAVVVPIVAAAVVLAIKLMPKPVAVPNVKGQPSVFAAQKILNKDGFVLAPKSATLPNPTNKPAGSIADQSPPAGTKSRKGTLVTVAVYTAAANTNGNTKVPSVLGDSPTEADQALHASSLTLGTVSPQPLDPAGKISMQWPLAGTAVPAGTRIAVFLAAVANKAGGAEGGKSATTSGAATGGTAGAATGGANGAGGGTAAAAAAGAASVAAVVAQAGKGPIPIPALSGDPTQAATKLSQLGLVPHPLKRLATVPPGQVAGTIPAAGAKVAKGAQVDLVISSGSPQLAYDNGQTIRVIDPTTHKASGTVPAVAPPEVEASWSPNGKEIIYEQNGELVLDKPNVKNAKPFQMTAAQPGVSYANPSFAPQHSSLIAFIEYTTSGAHLCIATIGPNVLHPSCTSKPGWDLGGQVNWSPDGSKILVLGTTNHGANFGLLEYTSNVPFSTQASNWGPGTLMTNNAIRQQGVYAGEFSPNGKKLALVAGSVVGGFNLYVVPANDFRPTQAQQVFSGACQVSWRPDGRELAVMRPNAICSPTALGTIVAVDLANPGTTTTLATQAAHPAWQPVPTGG